MFGFAGQKIDSKDAHDEKENCQRDLDDASADASNCNHGLFSRDFYLTTAGRFLEVRLARRFLGFFAEGESRATRPDPLQCGHFACFALRVLGNAGI